MGKRLLKYTMLAFLAATVLVVLGATQVHEQYALFRVEEIPWSDCLVWASIQWYSWALLVPFVALLARHFQFDSRARILRGVVVHVVGAVTFTLAHACLQTVGILLFASNTLSDIENFREGVPRLLVSQLHWELMSYAMVVAATQFGMYMRRAHEDALARQELETHAVRAQLGALKRQMQPHFLFNALNAQVSMLTEGSPAQRFTIRLADMLRMILSSSDQATATLGEEIALVNAYLEVERVRFGSRLATRIDVPAEMAQIRLPSLILQPLVENAITHGIGRSMEGGDIVVKASHAGSEATVEVINTGADTTDTRNGVDGQRITQANCRQRLALMYGQRARFEAGYTIGNSTYRAAIVLPYSASDVEVGRDATEDTDRRR